MNSRVVLLNVSYVTCFIEGPRDTCLAADEVGTRGSAALLEPTSPRKLGARVARLKIRNTWTFANVMSSDIPYLEHE